MQFQKRDTVYSDMQLLNALLDFKLNSEEFMKNEKVVETISSVVDKLKKKDKGYILFSAVHGLQRKLILVTCSGLTSYKIYTWTAKEQIEKPFEATIHEENTRLDIETLVEEKCYDYSYAQRDEMIQAMLVESLTGYSINKDKGIEFMQFRDSDGQSAIHQSGDLVKDPFYNEMITLGRKFTSTMSQSMKGMENKIKAYAEKLSCEDLNLQVDHSNIWPDRMFLGKIVDVREMNNRRYYQVKYLRYRRQTSPLEVGTVVGAVTAGTTSKDMNLNALGKCYLVENRDYHSNYDQYDAEDLRRIPYNMVDEGRLLIGFRRSSNSWNLVVGPDPKVFSDADAQTENETSNLLDRFATLSTDLRQTKISSESGETSFYVPFEQQSRKDNPHLSPLALRMKSLKKMVDEHNYLVKKKAAIGSDVFITDKIKYNHAEGKIAYNDFSIAVDDELIKARLFQHFDAYLVSYYRGDKTEQAILDSLLDTTFDTVADRVQANHKGDFTINMKVNDTIDLAIEGRVSKNKALLLYLNGQRFNKNELLEVVREITCYRSQEEANRFITNIGRLGLSVYIGITTGYEVEYPLERGQDEDDRVRRIFKFRKLKGRSNYELILDTTHIPLRGKKLITILYQNFNKERVPDFHGKIDRFIFDSCENSLNYLKYRFLIDSSYEAFKDKAREFLDKKVADTESEYVNYFNKKSRKNMEGIKITGTSGNTYVVAYDSNDSFVFIDPVKVEGKTQDNGLDIYQEGKYICMIDQSNIKSNIGYDTVVSKLLALKNDSSIAHTIYNLEEEIGG